MSPLFWMFMALFSLAIEAITKCRLISIWITFGCLVAGVLALFGVPSIVQFGVATAVSLLALRFARDKALIVVDDFFDTHTEGKLGEYSSARILGTRVQALQSLGPKRREGVVVTRAGKRYDALYEGERKLKSQEWAVVVDRIGEKLIVADIEREND